MAIQWTREAAVAELNLLMEQAGELDGEDPYSARHTAWILRTQKFISEAFGEDSIYYKSLGRLQWRGAGTGVIGGPARPEESWDPNLGIERMAREGFTRALNTARGVLEAARARLDSDVEMEQIYESKDTGPEASLLIKTINLVEHKLRKVLRDPPQNEKVFQEAFENLLIGADVQYSREAKSIEYSSKTYTPDFTVDKADLAIELKVCLDGRREKALPAEINDDILAYTQEYGNLLFVVYDTGNIRDVDRFVGNFEEHEGVVVRVVKH